VLLLLLLEGALAVLVVRVGGLGSCEGLVPWAAAVLAAVAGTAAGLS
jgi:hypothetical protein